MSIMNRIQMFFKVKNNTTLNHVEDPHQTTEHAYPSARREPATRKAKMYPKKKMQKRRRPRFVRG